jgi:hypothetical protein
VGSRPGLQLPAGAPCPVLRPTGQHGEVAVPGPFEQAGRTRGALAVAAHDRGRAVRLADGMLEWRLADQPVTTGAA